MEGDGALHGNHTRIACDNDALSTRLDGTLRQMDSGDVHAAIESLVVFLSEVRSSLSGDAWTRAIAICRAHPICRLLHHDPLTRRSYRRPRGYSGDAEMLDMIYDHDAHSLCLSGTAKAVFQYTAGDGRSPKAVRNRREILARIIDDICLHTEQARILSVAGGHLREAELSQALAEQRIADWVAIDQDAQSVDECRRRYSGLPVRPLRGTVREILAGKKSIGKFDFVYAAGLFDYLSDPVAKALVSTMASLLAPGGKLLMANFAPSHVDSGYMEAFMDWRLIYRTGEEIQKLFAGPAHRPLIRTTQFVDELKAIIYAMGERASSEC